MSFAKAQQLLQLATIVAGRHAGITLDEVEVACPPKTDPD